MISFLSALLSFIVDLFSRKTKELDRLSNEIDLVRSELYKATESGDVERIVFLKNRLDSLLKQYEKRDRR